jgi:hypothetical protein
VSTDTIDIPYNDPYAGITVLDATTVDDVPTTMPAEFFNQNTVTTAITYYDFSGIGEGKSDAFAGLAVLDEMMGLASFDFIADRKLR